MKFLLVSLSLVVLNSPAMGQSAMNYARGVSQGELSQRSPTNHGTVYCEARCYLSLYDGPRVRTTKWVSDVDWYLDNPGSYARATWTVRWPTDLNPAKRIEDCWTQAHQVLLRQVKEAHGMTVRNWCAVGNLHGFHSDGPNQPFKRVDLSNFSTID